jgi:hypothetical protein
MALFAALSVAVRGLREHEPYASTYAKPEHVAYASAYSKPVDYYVSCNGTYAITARDFVILSCSHYFIHSCTFDSLNLYNFLSQIFSYIYYYMSMSF